VIPWVKFAIERGSDGPVLRAHRKRKTLYGKTRKEAVKKLARALSDREGVLAFDAGGLRLRRTPPASAASARWWGRPSGHRRCTGRRSNTYPGAGQDAARYRP